MYEHKNSPLISRKHFHQRMINHVLLAVGMVILSLAVGVVGHIYFDDMPLSKAVVASTTLMSGLGLSVLPASTHGQVFASIYGILCSYLYIATSTIVISPILHRTLHRFHLDE